MFNAQALKTGNFLKNNVNTGEVVYKISNVSDKWVVEYADSMGMQIRNLNDLTVSINVSTEQYDNEGWLIVSEYKESNIYSKGNSLVKKVSEDDKNVIVQVLPHNGYSNEVAINKIIFKQFGMVNINDYIDENAKNGSVWVNVKNGRQVTVEFLTNKSVFCSNKIEISVEDFIWGYNKVN